MIRNIRKIKVKYGLESKKKGGFTLIEVIAVIAIIGILAAAMLPKIGGYVKEAKKTKIVDQCRKVVMAVESYNLTSTTPIAKSVNVSVATGTVGVSKYLDGVTLDKLDTANTTVQKCYDVVGGGEFDIDDQEKLKVTSATLTPSPTT